MYYNRHLSVSLSPPYHFSLPKERRGQMTPYIYRLPSVESMQPLQNGTYRVLAFGVLCAEFWPPNIKLFISPEVMPCLAHCAAEMDTIVSLPPGWKDCCLCVYL